MNYNKNVRTTDNTQLANQLTYKGADTRVVSFEDEVRKWFKVNKARMSALCGSEEEANRLVLSALNSISKTPTLIECTFDSWIRCLMTSAEYNLYPGAMAECAYVPFNNNKVGAKEATFILMYQGLCQLLYRTGMVKSISAEIHCANDVFRYKRGSNEELTHEPAEGGLEDRGEWLGVYSIVRNTMGGETIVYMDAKEVDSIRARSKGANSPDSPWNSKHATDVAWMWKKTALKQNKFVPRGSVGLVPSAVDSEGEEESSRINVTVDRTSQAIGQAPRATPRAQEQIAASTSQASIEIPVTSIKEVQAPQQQVVVQSKSTDTRP